MKAIEINGEIKTFNSVPKVWKDTNGTHLNIGDGKSFGFKDVVYPDFNGLIQELSNLHLAGDVFTYDVINKPTKETLEELKQQKIAELKNTISRKLSETDWYIIREADAGAVTPQDIKNSRAALRAKSNTMEAEINALNTKSEVLLYDINI